METLFNGLNPLLQEPVLEVDIPNLEPWPGERKVRVMHKIPDNLLACPAIFMVDTDFIGAFDQKHVIKETGQRAHYQGKGMITKSFTTWGKWAVSDLIPTDYSHKPIGLNRLHIPSAFASRSSVRIAAEKMFEIEFIARSSCEGSMAKKAAERQTICGQNLPQDLRLGQMLPRPYFTPTKKSKPGEKDTELTLDEYYDLIGNKTLANYLYGMTILIHLRHRHLYYHKHLDRTDQKMEFGQFLPNLPTECFFENGMVSWTLDNAVDIFSSSCKSNYFNEHAWEEMPHFNIGDFAECARENSKTGIFRLADETGGTDDGRVRLMINTITARKLHEKGSHAQADTIASLYECKELFRKGSERTKEGGYEKSAKDIVHVPYELCYQTGQHNLAVRLMLGNEIETPL